MSDTPETDNAVFNGFEDGAGMPDIVEADFARKLERERDEAREDLEEEMKFHHRTHGECVIAQCELMDVKKERDEAREALRQIQAAGWQDQATIEAKALVECWEKAERYRLEANAMMAKLHELQTYADKLADGLPAGMLPRDVENLREANAGLADDLQKAERERDNLKSEKEANYQCLLILERDLYKAREERDKAISVADRLIEYAHECLVKLESWGQGYQRYEEEMDTIREDIAAYDMMKEALK